MHHVPTALMQRAADETAVAFPGNRLGAEKDGGSLGGKSFQFLQAPCEFRCLHVGFVAALAVAAEQWPHPGVAYAPGDKEGLEVFAPELVEAAHRVATHVHGVRDAVVSQQREKLISRLRPGPDGVDGLRAALPMLLSHGVIIPASPRLL